MRVREEAGHFVVERAEPAPRKINLDGIWGAIPGLKPLSPEDRVFEERELDWDGKLLKRD
ncbi:hypothetical protein [Sphingomonas xinjiangensis]|uniref:Antitoxin VapB n=1 Tax=Sphingomonas xinjiangensis TaxID=643568 RepID=A0A840YNC1_9SPHN|nr:hypothetical protein [Sphingomonas xinjiangensis]